MEEELGKQKGKRANERVKVEDDTNGNVGIEGADTKDLMAADESEGEEDLSVFQKKGTKRKATTPASKRDGGSRGKGKVRKR